MLRDSGIWPVRDLRSDLILISKSVNFFSLGSYNRDNLETFFCENFFPFAEDIPGGLGLASLVVVL